MSAFEYTLSIACSTSFAIDSPLLIAKIVGPAPEIPAPNAPDFKAAFFTESKCGMSFLRTGSTITSVNDLLIKS